MVIARATVSNHHRRMNCRRIGGMLVWLSDLRPSIFVFPAAFQKHNVENCSLPMTQTLASRKQKTEALQDDPLVGL